MPTGQSFPPSPLGSGVGSRFRCACGYNLAVHSAQKQHEPECPKHFSHWDVMGMWDAEKHYCREHWNTAKENNSVRTDQYYSSVYHIKIYKYNARSDYAYSVSEFSYDITLCQEQIFAHVNETYCSKLYTETKLDRVSAHRLNEQSREQQELVLSCCVSASCSCSCAVALTLEQVQGEQQQEDGSGRHLYPPFKEKGEEDNPNYSLPC